MQISGTSCGGSLVNYIVSYGQSVCMDSSKPVINLNGLQISGSCTSVTPTPTPTNGVYCYTSGLTYYTATYQCPNNGVDYLDQYGVIKVTIFKDLIPSGDHPDYSFTVTNGTEVESFEILRGQEFNEFIYPKVDFRYTDTGCTTTTLNDWFISNTAGLGVCSFATPTPTPTNTITPTPTLTNTITPSPTNTLTPNLSPSVTPSNTATPTVTPTITASQTVTPSITPTKSPTSSPSPTVTPSPTNTPICNNFVLGFQPYNTLSGGNALAYSTNGINISGSSPNANSFLTFSNPAGITSIATNGSRWVGVGSNGRVTPNAISLGLYSNNGIQWFLSDLANVRTNANSGMEDVIWDGTRFLAIAGSTNPLTQSTDGITWTAITGSNISLSTGLPAIREAFIYFDGTSHWAGGNSNFYKSNGGNVYTAQTITGINRFWDMLYTQNKWILGGSLVSGSTSGKIFVSNDSINWTGQTIPACTDVYTLVTNGNIIVAGGEGTTDLMYSYDGIGWTAATYAGVFTTRVYDLAWNGSVFMGVGGDAGQIGYSYDGINWSASTSTLVNFIGQAVASIPDPYVFPAIAVNCPTVTPTNTSTSTPQVSPTITPSITPTITASNTPTPSITPTNTLTPTNTQTNTPTSSITPTLTPTNTVTPTNTLTPSPTNTCVCTITVDNNGTGIGITDVQCNTQSVTYVNGDNFTVDAGEFGTFETDVIGASITFDISYGAHTGQKNINLVDCDNNVYCSDTLNTAGGTYNIEGVVVQCNCTLTIVITDGACL